MTGRVTIEEAKTIHAYFRAVRIVRDLTDLAETRKLTSREGATLRENMGRVEALRGQVKHINERVFGNNNQSGQAAAA